MRERQPMAVQKAGQILTEQQFNGNNELVTLYGNYKTYIAEQEKLLKKTSTWDLYNKGKKAYEEATIRYDIANNLFNTYKNLQRKAEKKYDQLVTEYYEKHGKDYKMTTTEKGTLASKSGLTDKLRRSVSDTEIESKLALDARANAVNTQRHGLYYNV